MSKSIWELLWNNFLEKYFLFGKRWILLVTALLVLALSQMVKQYYGLDNLKQVTNSSFFIISSILVVFFGLVYFLLETKRPPPKDHFVIAVAKFYPVTEGAKDWAVDVRDKIIEALTKRLSGNEIKGTVKPLRETVDPRNEEGRKQAHLLREYNRAHMVVCGTVRIPRKDDEEYQFSPYISKLVTQSHRFSPGGDVEALEVVIDDKFLEFEKQKFTEITDLATFICGMAELNRFQYKEAAEILSTIEEPSGEVWFYRGFSWLELEEKELALLCFLKATEVNPNLFHPWMFAGMVFSDLERHKEASVFYTQAHLVAEKHPRDKLLELKEALHSLEKLRKYLSEIHKTMDKMEGTLCEAEKSQTAFEYSDQGIKHLSEGDYEKARAACHKAIMLCPNDGLTWAIMGLALAKLNRLQQAAEALSKGEKFGGRHYTLARGFAVLGDKDKMLYHLSVATEEDPNKKFEARYTEEFKHYRNDKTFTELTHCSSDKDTAIDNIDTV